jgi:hypothetical protein
MVGHHAEHMNQNAVLFLPNSQGVGNDLVDQLAWMQQK